MTPGQTFDPRDPWAKARRIEIYRHGRVHGATDIQEDMPKDLMVRRLKARNIPPPVVPPRMIGKGLDPRSGDTSPTSHQYTGRPPQEQPPAETVMLTADEVAERDWQQQSQQRQRAAPPVKTDRPMTITEVRQELKRRGIKMKRTDNLVTLRAMLNGQ